MGLLELKIIKFVLIFLSVSFIGQNISGQALIKGSLSDIKGEGLSDINIMIYPTNRTILVAYAVSDSVGHFQVSVKIESDSLDIETNSMQYRRERIRVANISQMVKFTLIPDIKQLETFTVKATPIEKRGDTISYLVSSFAGKEDRAIVDVLRRMPGIEVEPNGRILYQGLPLQKFYVEGLDLMDGRYGVVSNNLPHCSVSAVEILENHQPVRILEDRTSTIQSSLNLKLKRDVTTTGTANVGVGLSPTLWDANITPMIFTKDFQVVTSYQTNNTGKDESQQLKVFTLDDLLKDADHPVENPEMLTIQTVNPPGINQNLYLDNNVHLLNFNGLLRLNRDFQLRSNLYYINDNQKAKATQQRTLYTPTDTLIFTENINNYLHNNYLLSEFTLSRNVKKNYLSNSLKIQTRWDKREGVLLNGNESIEQSLKSPLQSISNELQSVNPVGKYLVDFQSYISYDNSPHSLEVTPGQFELVLNQETPFEKVTQQIDLKRFYADHAASLVFSWKKLNFTPRLGITYRRQMLESHILLTRHEEETSAGTDFSNALDGSQTRVYTQTEVEYRKSSFTIKAKLPLSWQHVQLSDQDLKRGQTLCRVLFDPKLSVNYQMNGFWRVNSSWSFTHSLGDMDKAHYGYILRNYRVLNQNAASLSETSRHSFSSYLSYRNPITSFFNTFSYIYAISHDNLMYSSIVQDDGTTVLQSFLLPNTSLSHNLHGQTSKYFAATKTTISFQANVSQRNRKSLMNEELFNTKNLFYNFVPGANVRITSWLNAEYELNASYIRTFIENDRKNNISMIKHKVNVFAFPTNNQLISFKSEYYDYKGSNNIFVDMLYRYTVKKRKIDLELRWNNIFNSKNYTSYEASAFTVWESTYVLRPSQLFVSVKFSF
jgi:hypothetical protein